VADASPELGEPCSLLGPQEPPCHHVPPDRLLRGSRGGEEEYGADTVVPQEVVVERGSCGGGKGCHEQEPHLVDLVRQADGAVRHIVCQSLIHAGGGKSGPQLISASKDVRHLETADGLHTPSRVPCEEEYRAKMTFWIHLVHLLERFRESIVTGDRSTRVLLFRPLTSLKGFSGMRRRPFTLCLRARASSHLGSPPTPLRQAKKGDTQRRRAFSCNGFGPLLLVAFENCTNPVSRIAPGRRHLRDPGHGCTV